MGLFFKNRSPGGNADTNIPSAQSIANGKAPHPLHDKSAVIAHAFTALRREIVGQEHILREVENLITPWFLYPEAQRQPLVINLWGMTGTGKSSLVRSLVEKLDMKARYGFFDIGEMASAHAGALKNMLLDDLRSLDGKPAVLCFDEFQFARTRSQEGAEFRDDPLRVLWELLDTGSVSYHESRDFWLMGRAIRMLSILERFTLNGGEIREGCVVKETELFNHLTEGFYFNHGNRNESPGLNYFLSDDFLNGIEILMEDEDLTRSALRKRIEMFNLSQLLEMVDSVVNKKPALKQMDFRQALIFITGNLDEVYSLNGVLDPDITADELHKLSLSVNITHVKSALQRRFRNEQLARLGNNHLIYHSLREAHFREIIRRELNHTAAFVKQHQQLELRFDESVVDLVYAEGVIPSQGVRPVRTTVGHLVEGNIARMLMDLASVPGFPAQVNWKFSQLQFELEVLNAEGIRLQTLHYKPVLKVNDMRRQLSRDAQAHTAIHESGHAIVAALTLRILPSLVVSASVSESNSGFCIVNYPKGMETRGTLYATLMSLLGGLVAEKIVFGEENTSSGVASDLWRITRLASDIIRNYGMGGTLMELSMPNDQNPTAVLTNTAEETAIRQLVDKAAAETEQLLQRNKMLLLQMGRTLTQTHRIGEAEIRELMVKWSAESWVKESGFVRPEDYFSFETLIESQIAELEKEPQ